MATEPWVSVEDVAKDWIYRWTEHKGLPARQVGRQFKLTVVDESVRTGGAGPEGREPAGEGGHR